MRGEVSPVPSLYQSAIVPIMPCNKASSNSVAQKHQTLSLARVSGWWGGSAPRGEAVDWLGFGRFRDQQAPMGVAFSQHLEV